MLNFRTLGAVKKPLIFAAYAAIALALNLAPQARSADVYYSTKVLEAEAEKSKHLADGEDLNRIYPVVKSFECTAAKKTFVIAQTVVHAPAQVVFAVLSDYPRAVENFSYLKKCKVISSGGQNKQIAFDAIALSGALTLSYVLNVRETPPYMIEFTRRSGAFKQNEGFWKLESIDSGRNTLVTFAKHVDAGLLVPKWFTVRELNNTAPKILDDLRQKAELDESEIAQAAHTAIAHRRAATVRSD